MSAVIENEETEFGGEIGAQAGPQYDFLCSTADIAIYGGQAGGGKSFALLLDPLRFTSVRGFGAVIFRRESTDLTQEGGLWDEAMKIYPFVGGRPRESQGKLDFRFFGLSRISFSHLQTEDTVQKKMGGQIAMIGFDELTHFTEKQFWLMLSRNRSTCGVKPYVRATCNPNADSWVAKLIDWWIDPITGFPISKRWWDRVSDEYVGVERSGVLRWLVKLDDALNWFDSREEAEQWCAERNLKIRPKSVTFIPASVYDNPALLQKDPDYIGNLQAQNRIDRARLLEGNWKVRAQAGLVFQRTDFQIMTLKEWTRLQKDVVKTVRRWDFAGTEAKRARDPGKMSAKLLNDPDWTAGVKASMLKNGDIVITDLIRDRLTPGKVEELVAATAKKDGKKCTVWIPEDPGQAGKAQVEHYAKRVVPTFILRSERETGSKLLRVDGYSAYVEHGHVYILEGAWNDTFLSEHDAFPSEGVHDDIVDAAGGAYRALRGKQLSTVELMARALGKRQ